MALLATNKGGDFTPAPAGVHLAVCCDVVDLGYITTEYQGNKRTFHACRFTFQLAKKMDDGRPFICTSARLNLSTDPKSGFSNFVQSWIGRQFTADEMANGFDADTLLGECAILNVVHNKVSKDGRETVYANIKSITPMMDGMVPIAVTHDYVRVKDRPQAQAQAKPDEFPGDDPFAGVRGDNADADIQF